MFGYLIDLLSSAYGVEKQHAETTVHTGGRTFSNDRRVKNHPKAIMDVYRIIFLVFICI